MTMQPLFVAVDIEGALIAWAKRQVAVRELFKTRIWDAYDPRAASAMQLVINRIGSTTQLNKSFEVIQVQLDIFAPKGARKMAKDGALTVKSVLLGMSNENLSDGVFGMGVTDVRDFYLPDDTTGAPRYAITAWVSAGAIPSDG